MFRPGLVVKSGKYSAGKTSGSFYEMKDYKYGEQINIANQPSGYNHITINTGLDLVNLFRDISNYHKYYTSYPEKLERYDILVDSVKNKMELTRDDVFVRAHNIVKTHKFFIDLKSKVQIKLGVLPATVMNPHQALEEIKDLENYFNERDKFVEEYGDDLPLGMANFIILDEAQLYFGSRQYKENFSGENEPLKDMIAYPVKVNTRIDLITQSSMMLDINFRRQASTYKMHETALGGLLLRTRVVEVKDPEKVNLDDADEISRSYRLNYYKLFGYPRLQYYRTHLISPKAKNIYTPGLYFKVLQAIAKYNSSKGMEKLEKEVT